MQRPPQRPTQIQPRFQYSLADIFVAPAFSAVAVLTGIYFYRVASLTSADRWHVGNTGMVALARCLSFASCSCIGGAIGTLLQKRFIGVLIGVCVGYAIFAHWVPT